MKAKPKQKTNTKLVTPKQGELTISFRVTRADRPHLIEYMREEMARLGYKLNSIRQWGNQ